jgi:hypothetical protein
MLSAFFYTGMYLSSDAMDGKERIYMGRIYPAVPWMARSGFIWDVFIQRCHGWQGADLYGMYLSSDAMDGKVRICV